MCMICAGFQPWLPDCGFDTSPPVETGSGTIDNSLPVYTTDQIAFQLTNGYWGGASYKFDATQGDTLTVDLSRLTTAGQDMARQALQAWSDVTGLLFSETAASQGAATGIVTEGPDAASGIFTGYSMQVGQDFDGRLGSTADRDAVAITLAAGQRITIALKGDTSGGDALADPYLRLRDGSGAILMENDDHEGSDSFISFQAQSAGTYYIQAGSYMDSLTGDYRIEVRQGLTNPDITFDDANSGAYAQFWTSGSTITRASVNISSTWAGGSNRTDGY